MRLAEMRIFTYLFLASAEIWRWKAIAMSLEVGEEIHSIRLKTETLNTLLIPRHLLPLSEQLATSSDSEADT